MKNYVFVFGLYILLLSCNKRVDSYIDFAEHQPLGVDEISEIPKSFLGNYISSDSTFISIEKDRIIHKWFDEDKTSIRDKDSVSYITFYKDHLVDNDTKQKAKFITKNDSIYWKIQHSDTVFIKDNILKLYKDALILNSDFEDRIYVNIYKKENKQIRKFSLFSKEDFEKLNKEIKIDGQLNFNETDTTITINPSRAQFRKLLRLKDFTLETIYNKI